MESKNKEMSVKDFLEKLVYPVCPPSQSRLRKNFKKEFAMALKAYDTLREEICALDEHHADLALEGISINSGDQLKSIIKQYTIDVRTRGHHLLNCFSFLQFYEVCDAMLTCKGWMRECVRNKVWRPLTKQIFDENDPDDMNSHEYLWWRQRFMKLCM